ncbi:MAG TPA: CPBP family intramembrane glutamic endopeptidase [Chryseolinea sp.]|nr:CPBP family intramembrane glutamic endopeptidase [Chryseolinea sp.]
MNNRRTFIFLLLAFGWSWINWSIALYFLSDGINDESIGQFVKYFFIGVYGPVIASIVATLMFGGLSETLALLKKIFIWKFPAFNYLAAFILPLILLGSGIVLYSLFVGSPGNIGEQAALAIPLTLWRSLFAGPLGEELGWRGFLLPELQKDNSAIKSSVIVGFIHCIWHLPLFWAPFGALPSGQPFSPLLMFTYLVLVICWSCIQTWLVNNSKGSVLIAILFHLFINVGIVLMFFPEIYTDADKAKSVYYLSSVITIPFTIFLCMKTKLISKGA